MCHRIEMERGEAVPALTRLTESSIKRVSALTEELIDHLLFQSVFQCFSRNEFGNNA